MYISFSYTLIFISMIFINLFVFGRAMTLISVALGRTFHYVDEILPFRFCSLFLDLFINSVIWLGHIGRVNKKQYDEHCLDYKFLKGLSVVFPLGAFDQPYNSFIIIQYHIVIKFLWNTILILQKKLIDYFGMQRCLWFDQVPCFLWKSFFFYGFLWIYSLKPYNLKE